MSDGKFAIGGDLPVNRLGFGAMRLTGPNVWGPPEDLEQAIAVARRAVELGADFIDTADSYGPGANEELLAQALYPYPEHVVIASKAGQSRPSRREWKPLGRPEYLRQQAELSLRRLRLERIDLFQLHRIDPQVPLADQLGALKQLQDEGKIRHIGLSEVSVAQIEQARRIVEVVSVQNLYHIGERGSEEVLRYCERENLAFIAWAPLARGAATDPVVTAVAEELAATPAQVLLAWLLRKSPVMIPIPGTSSVSHLEENAAAERLELSDKHFTMLSAIGEDPGGAQGGE